MDKETDQVSCPMSHSWHLKPRSLDPEFMFLTTALCSAWFFHAHGRDRGAPTNSSLYVLCLVELTNAHGFNHYIRTVNLAQLFSHFSLNLPTWMSGRHHQQPVPTLRSSSSDSNLQARSSDPSAENLAMSYHCPPLALVPLLFLLSLQPHLPHPPFADVPF